MKFGKRRKNEAEPAAEPAGVTTSAPPAPEPVTDSWTAPVAAAGPGYAADGDSGEPLTPDLSHAAVTEPEPVVEGEAVELYDEVPAAEPMGHAGAGEPVPVQFAKPPGPAFESAYAAAQQPVAVAASSIPVSPGVAAPEAYTPGHGSDAHAAGPSPQEQVMALADERPELVVAAAFAGGLLVAMILRRLGN